jgi:hypothetical protein
MIPAFKNRYDLAAAKRRRLDGLVGPHGQYRV